MSLSAWCTTAPGITNHDSAHRVCEMRMRLGLIQPCDCEDHKKKDAHGA